MLVVTVPPHPGVIVPEVFVWYPALDCCTGNDNDPSIL